MTEVVRILYLAPGSKEPARAFAVPDTARTALALAAPDKERARALAVRAEPLCFVAHSPAPADG